MSRTPRRLRERGEESYRARRVRGAPFATSRQVHGDLAVVVKRFPARVPDTGLSFVLVHGLGVSSRYFQPLAAELARHGAVHLVDLPGYGAAPNPRRDVPLADHAAVLGAFLERSGIRDPVIVGHSMGAQVVAALALDHPEVAAAGVVLMAPSIDPEARSPLRAIGALLRDIPREPLPVIGIALTDYLLRCGLPYLLRQLPHMLGDPLEARLPWLGVRALLVTGDHDPIVTDAWARELAGLVGGDPARHEVRGPHVIMHTAPEMIAGHILDFVAAGAAGRSGGERRAGGERREEEGRA